jgi:hypothetical protein
MKGRLPILAAMVALVVASLGCVINLGGPELPPETIPASPDAAVQLKEQFRAALENARNSDGSVTFTMTEAQLTSLLASRLEEEPDPFLTEPQVFLREGQMRIYGKANRGLFAATVGIVVSAGIDDQGKPTLTVASADFGPLPAPEGLINTLTDFVTEAYTSALGPVATGFRLEQLDIANGNLTLTGQVQ